ncbi:hypothetical protein [Streptomyces qinzhouensis]|nr:hypothetical protein [Streptomyces qinzhouensis]
MELDHVLDSLADARAGENVAYAGRAVFIQMWISDQSEQEVPRVLRGK